MRRPALTIVSKSISLALPLVLFPHALLPHITQEFRLHRLLQRSQCRGRPALRQHRRAALLYCLVVDDRLLFDLRVHIEWDQPAVQRRIRPAGIARPHLPSGSGPAPARRRAWAAGQARAKGPTGTTRPAGARGPARRPVRRLAAEPAGVARPAEQAARRAQELRFRPEPAR